MRVAQVFDWRLSIYDFMRNGNGPTWMLVFSVGIGALIIGMAIGVYMTMLLAR